jgi:DNA-directed RNA polymerase I, II, and III subunit RPABC1
MTTEEEISRYRRIRKTCLEMLRDRKYQISEEEYRYDKRAFEEHFCDKLGTAHLNVDKLTIVAFKAGDESDKIAVLFPEKGELSTEGFRRYKDKLTDLKVGRAIFVVSKQPTGQLKKAIQDAPVEVSITVEIFQDIELLINITHHELVPKHEPLTSAEKQQLLERYKLKDSQLPRMQLADPVSRYFGLSRGDVVRIIRDSETAGRYVTYRLVH